MAKEYYKLKQEGELKHYVFQGVADILPIILSTMKKQAEEVIVYYDTDIDGVVAGTIARRFVEFFLKKEAVPYINRNRQHGFKMPKDDNLKGKHIIGVDFGITSKEMQEITSKGATVIIMDHHDCEEEVILYDNGKRLDYKDYRHNKEKLRTLMNKSGVGILINNQYKRVPADLTKPRISGENTHSHYLSGAGVVFESFLAFIKRYIPAKLSLWDTKEQRGMVGWTLLSDMRDIENVNARKYLEDLYTYKVTDKQALTHPGVDVLRNLKQTRQEIRQNSIYEQDKFGSIKLDRINIDFHLSPLMNANFRFDNGDAVVDYMWGDIGAIDMKAHMMQKKLKKTIETIVDEEGTGRFYGEDDDLYVFHINKNHPLLKQFNTDVSNFVGLVCNSKKRNCNVIGYVTEDNRLTRASFRGNIQEHYKDELNAKGYLKGAGHEGAFGILEMDTSDENFEHIAEVCHELEMGKEHNQHPIIKVANLARLCEGNALYSNDSAISEAYRIAYENMFHMENKKICLKYTGAESRISGEWNEAKTRCRYEVDGRYIICYTYPITPKTGLICPILEDGIITFSLIEKTK